VRAILLVRLGALGDVVHAMPVVHALSTAWPAVRIDWLVDPRYAPMVRMVRGLARAVAFDPRGLMTSERRSDTLAVLAGLRRERYDVVYDLQGLVKSAAAARLAGGDEVVGFGRADLREPAARFFYTRMVDVSAEPHVIDKNLRLVGGASPAVFALDVPSPPWIDAVRAASGDAGFIVINPGAAWPNKRWPAARFGALAAALRASHGVASLVLWGPGEEQLADAVVDASGGAARRAPATDIVESFALLREARLAVAGDTGPLHVAGAVGTPVVGLFGPTYAERNGPWHRDDAVVSRTAVCQCHYERQCRLATPCIDAIGVDDVVTAARTVLGARTGGAHA
jgi:lipopolysaccharide heptosyltransferase I